MQQSGITLTAFARVADMLCTADKEKDDKVEADDVAVPMDRTQDASKLGRQVAPGESSSSSSSSSSDGQAEHLYSGMHVLRTTDFFLVHHSFCCQAVCLVMTQYSADHKRVVLLACKTVGSTYSSVCSLTCAA